MLAATMMHFLINAAISTTMNYAVDRTAHRDWVPASTDLLAVNGLAGGALGLLLVGGLIDWFQPTYGNEGSTYGMAAMLVTALVGWPFFLLSDRKTVAAVPKAAER